MATAKKTDYGVPSNQKATADPVNSEQLEAQDASKTATEPQPTGPTTGELEERAAQAEERADAAERRSEAFAAELEELKRQMAALMKSSRTGAAQQRPDRSIDEMLEAGEVPVFEEDEPYGLVVGDTQVAYVQNGHQFDRAKQYVATEKNRGCPRAFNPRLVGFVKPRPGQTLADSLDGFRDQV